MTFPSEIPVMTLTGVTLFPHAMMPLHIFEPRYRKMLHDVLENNSMFAIATLDEEKACLGDESEPPMPYATIGVVRACKKNEDGTSNLVLAGMQRVKIEEIVQEEPYRVIRVSMIKSINTHKKNVAIQAKAKLIGLLNCKLGLGAEIPEQALRLIESFDDPEMTIDLSGYAMIGDLETKMQMLGEPDVLKRYDIAREYLQEEVCELKLDKKLRGSLGVDEVDLN